MEAFDKRERRPQGQSADHDQYQHGHRRGDLKSASYQNIGPGSGVAETKTASKPFGTTYSIRSGIANGEQTHFPLPKKPKTNWPTKKVRCR
jgi:hypothetical protein